MKIDFERLDRMATAGAPATAIIEALRVDFERDEARKVVKRPKDAERIRDKRNATRGDIVATSSDIERQAATIDDGWPNDFREQFWSIYPNKVGKPRALAKLEAIRKRGMPFSEIISGLENYIRSKPPDRQWLNPETFLNQERWADLPATVTPQGQNGRRTIHDAAKDLLAKVRAFDAEPPSGIRDGAGEPPLRLLSSG